MKIHKPKKPKVPKPLPMSLEEQILMERFHQIRIEFDQKKKHILKKSHYEKIKNAT